MGVEHTTVRVNGIGTLECFGTGQQSLNQSVQRIIVGVVGVDVSAQHRRVSQHSGLVHGNTDYGDFVDIPGNFTTALGHSEDRMSVGNIEEGDNQVHAGNELGNGVLAGEVQVQIEGLEYLALADIVEEQGKISVSAAGRLFIIHDGIPLRFGYPELSELNTMLNSPDNRAENAKLTIFDKNGNKVESFMQEETYYVGLSAENYIGENVGIQIIVAQYDENMVLQNTLITSPILIRSGTTIKMDHTGDNSLSFVPSANTEIVKFFVWDSIGNQNPLAEIAEARKVSTL